MTRPPNILVFLSDDHAQWAAGCYGNSEVRTPSMDHLARSGVRMDNAFTPCPVCSPARASLFTGKIPSAHGIHDHLALRDLPVGNHPDVRGQGTLAQSLKLAGYRTGLVGKWHCGSFLEPAEGFDFWFTLGGPDTTNAQFGPQPFIAQSDRVEKFGHQATHITDGALRFLREPDSRPFFLVLGYTNFHTPHSGEPSRLVESYRGATFRDIPGEAPVESHAAIRVKRPADPEVFREQMAQYYAAVSMVDEQSGRILDELDNRQITRDTLVIYTSDHGHNNGHHGIWCKGNATIPQNFYEESIRVPCLLSWPAEIPAGQHRAELVDHCDLFTTILAAAGACVPLTDSNAPRPGKSFLPLLTGAALANWRDAQFCEYGNARMIRTAQYKLIVRYPGPNGHYPDELYDLFGDPREVVNRAGDPGLCEIEAGLRRRIEEYFSRFEVPALAGTRIETLPRCNLSQPWDLDPASVT